MHLALFEIELDFHFNIYEFRILAIDAPNIASSLFSIGWNNATFGIELLYFSCVRQLFYNWSLEYIDTAIEESGFVRLLQWINRRLN